MTRGLAAAPAAAHGRPARRSRTRGAPAQGGRPRRRHGPVRLARRAAPHHRRPDRRGHRRRRRRLQRPAPRRAGRAAARRPAQGARRAVRRRRLGPDLGPGHPAPLQSARATCTARGRQPADRRPVGAARRPCRRPWTWSAGCSARTAGCCRCPPCRWSSRRSYAATTRTRPDERDHGARPGHRRAHPRRGAVGARSCPHDPPAVPEAVEAVLDADWVVLGPGSWFSSVIPHLLVPELLDALIDDQGPQGALAQPRAAARRNRGLLSAASFGGFGPTRP